MQRVQRGDMETFCPCLTEPVKNKKHQEHASLPLPRFGTTWHYLSPMHRMLIASHLEHFKYFSLKCPLQTSLW